MAGPTDIRRDLWCDLRTYGGTYGGPLDLRWDAWQDPPIYMVGPIDIWLDLWWALGPTVGRTAGPTIYGRTYGGTHGPTARLMAGLIAGPTNLWVELMAGPMDLWRDPPSQFVAPLLIASITHEMLPYVMQCDKPTYTNRNKNSSGT